ncbi:MAG: response regulator [Geminicoccaceae bacterium]
MAKVLIADDHPLFREALQIAIGKACPEEANQVLEAHDLDGAFSTLAEHSDVDLVLFDLKMPGAVGFSGLASMRQSHPDVPIVVISANEDPKTMREAITFGAMGFIPKSHKGDQIAAAVGKVLDGEVYLPEPIRDGAGDISDEEQKSLEVARRIASLTPQQLRVLKLIAEGKPNKIIAYEIDVAETTVKAHITAILRKLRVHSRTQAVLMAQTHLSADSIPS